MGDLDVDGKILTYVRQREFRGGLELWLEFGYWILRAVIYLILKDRIFCNCRVIIIVERRHYTL